MATDTLVLVNVGSGELAVILVVVLLIFGAERVPTLARSIGSAIREFRAGEADEPGDGDPVPPAEP